MKSATENTQAVTLTLVTDRGDNVQFELCKPDSFATAEGVYAVLRTRQLDNPMRATYGEQDNKFCIIYVGETPDLAQSIEQHRAEGWFEENGATHICFCAEPDPRLRSLLRGGLVRHYAPDCNSSRDA